MTTMRHRMQEVLNRLPAIDPIHLRVGVSDRVSDAMLVGAREALRYFLLGTTDAPPELLEREAWSLPTGSCTIAMLTEWRAKRAASPQRSPKPRTPKRVKA